MPHGSATFVNDFAHVINSSCELLNVQGGGTFHWTDGSTSYATYTVSTLLIKGSVGDVFYTGHITSGLFAGDTLRGVIALDATPQGICVSGNGLTQLSAFDYSAYMRS